MEPILFKIGSFPIYSYGLMVAAGFIAAVNFAINQLNYIKKGESPLTKDDLITLGITLLVGGVIGSRTLFVVQYWKHFQKNIFEIINITQGGLSINGGIIASLIIVFIFCRIKKISFLWLMDLIAPAIILGYAFGRLGCFLNGCCYGYVTNYPWGVPFHWDPVHYRVPTQLYATFINALNVIILIYFRPRLKFQGQLFSIGLMLYGTYRFIIEFFRDNPYYIWKLTLAQHVAVALFCAGIILFLTVRIFKITRTGIPKLENKKVTNT
ncbi:prolipoprotein diacylglyceryl transferase [Candidatus Margulisiibacteriota bacterium]